MGEEEALSSGVKQIIFSQFFSSFESGGITKHLMTGPSGNSEFCFPETLNVPRGKACTFVLTIPLVCLSTQC